MLSYSSLLPRIPFWRGSKFLPRCVVIEGGTEDKRFLASIQLLSSYKCANFGKSHQTIAPQNSTPEPVFTPCSCFSCTHIPQYLEAKKEYCSLDKKNMQDKGVLYTFADTFFFYSPYGLYLNQIRNLKQLLGNKPKSNGYVVCFAEIQNTLSSKEIYNTLLKILEEQKGDILFILTVPERHALVSTILSRSWVFTLPWQNSTQHNTLTTAYSNFTNMLLTNTGYFSKNPSFTFEESAMILAECTKTLARSYYSTSTSMLEEYFATLPPLKLEYCKSILQKAQMALATNTNPSLVIHYLYTTLRRLLHSQ